MGTLACTVKYQQKQLPESSMSVRGVCEALAFRVGDAELLYQRGALERTCREPRTQAGGLAFGSNQYNHLLRVLILLILRPPNFNTKSGRS